MAVVRRVGIGLAAGVVAGVVLGAVARLMMRLATLAAGGDTHFSWAGSAGIVLVFVVVAVPGAILAALVSRRGRSALLVVGALLLCVPAVGVAGEDLSGLGELSRWEMAGVGLAGAGVFAAILAMPFLTLRLLAVGGGRSRDALTQRRSRVPGRTAATP